MADLANDVQQPSIFDLLPEEERKQFAPPLAEQKSGHTTTKAKSSATPAQDAEPEEYDRDRLVYYAGHRMEVPSRTMKLEAVRAWLEETFPELSKERTEMLYDKETGHIIPVLRGHKKGRSIPTFTEHPNKNLPVYHFRDRYGLMFEIRRTQTGLFAVPIEQDAHTEARFALFVPKVPVSILAEIVRVFQSESDCEHLAYILWDRESGYCVHWPKQSATAVSVEAEGYEETEDRFMVMQIHSHGTMQAFFSTQDDADEVRTGLYGVVGRCNTPFPTVVCRYSCGGKYVLVNPYDVFAGEVSDVVKPQWI